MQGIAYIKVDSKIYVLFRTTKTGLYLKRINRGSKKAIFLEDESRYLSLNNDKLEKLLRGEVVIL